MRYLLLTRPAGMGDLIMMEPTIEALYYKHFPCEIILRSAVNYIDVLRGHPLITHFVTDDIRYKYGFPREMHGQIYRNYKGRIGPMLTIEGDLYIYDFEGCIEPNYGIHGVDAFAARAQVPLLRRDPFMPQGYDQDRIKLLAQCGGGVAERSLSQNDLPDNFEKYGGQIIGTMMLPTNEYVNMINRSEVFIGADSSGLHLAAALGVRNILGIYNECFPPQIRTYPGIRWIMRSEMKDNLAHEIDLIMSREKYPDYLNHGNAAEWIRNKAHQYCRGSGLDIGASSWPLYGAMPVDQHNREKYLNGKQRYDFIFSSHCLEHIGLWQQELELWDAHLKPGGIMFLYLPHHKMERWRPGGEWGGMHVWNPEPITLVKWIQENTGINIFDYSSIPDSYWSFYVIGRKPYA